MFRIDDPDPWAMHEDWGGPLAFAVWVLEVDGLRVPPFDAHPDGDRRLRLAGLTAEGWRHWVGELAARYGAGQAAMRTAAMPSAEHRARLQAATGDQEAMKREAQRWFAETRSSRRHAFAQVRHAGDAASAWSGPAAVATELATLHREFSRTRRRREDLPPWVTGPRDEAHIDEEHRLYTDLRNATPRPSQLDIHGVFYAAPALLPIPPQSLLIGIPRDAGWAAFAQLVRDGFRALAEPA